MARDRGAPSRVLDLVASFLSAETAGAVFLLGALCAALVWANSPLGASYEAFWHTPLQLAVGGTTLLELDLRHWVNDAVMVLFFFVVGLEIKRELVDGELNSRAKAIVPAVAALGGMVVPAAIYLAVNLGRESARGWAIPMATDIAFAVGALALLGPRVPRALTVFLLAVAIADDIGAIVVIAVVYAGAIDLVALGVAVLALGGVLVLWRLPSPWAGPPLVVLMVVVWAATLASGVHATIAGVALGLLAPVVARTGRRAVAHRLELALHPWTTSLVVPLFALANAGVVLRLDAIGGTLAGPVGLGIATGLVLGKPVGIVSAAWLATRLRLGALPDGIGWPQLASAAAVAGIGFTVSLFIAQLALAGAPLQQAKIGIFGGSLLAATVGLVLLARTLPRPAPGPGPT